MRNHWIYGSQYSSIICHSLFFPFQSCPLLQVGSVNMICVKSCDVLKAQSKNIVGNFMDGKKDIDEIGLSKLCRQSFQVYIKCKIFIFSAINDRYFLVTEMEREVETIRALD